MVAEAASAALEHARIRYGSAPCRLLRRLAASALSLRFLVLDSRSLGTQPFRRRLYVGDFDLFCMKTLALGADPLRVVSAAAKDSLHPQLDSAYVDHVCELGVTDRIRERTELAESLKVV